jgi:hypothetical protein
LDGKAITIQGVTVYGKADPLFTPFQNVSPEDQLCQATTAVPLIEHDLDLLPKAPDIVAVHDSLMALGGDAPGENCVKQSSIPGRVPLIIAGHTHKFNRETIKDTLMLHAGTTGADGIEAFRPDKSNPYTANLLTFVQVGGHMELAQLDKLTQPHQGNNVARQTIIDRYVVTEPWWLTHGDAPATLAKNQP